MPEFSNGKRFALVLSIIPGLGQVFLGRYFRGMVLFFASVILIDLVVIILPAPMIMVPSLAGIELTKEIISRAILVFAGMLWVYNIANMIRFTSSGKRKSRPDRKNLLFHEGLNCYLQDRFEEARDKFARVLKLDSHDPDATLYLGMTLQKLGQPRRAAKLFQKYFILAGKLLALRHTMGKFLSAAKESPIMNLITQSKKLDDQEHAEVKRHPDYGFEILSQIEGLDKTCAVACLQHHERIDGQGYPQALQRKTISNYAQIIGLVDRYEALTHPRAHRAKFLSDEALKIIIDLKDTAFKKELVKTLIDEVSFYPPGSGVQLSTGERGMVIGINKQRPFRPIVKITTDTEGNNLEEPRIVDLSQESSLSITNPYPSY